VIPRALEEGIDDLLVERPERAVTAETPLELRRRLDDGALAHDLLPPLLIDALRDAIEVDAERIVDRSPQQVGEVGPYPLVVRVPTLGGRERVLNPALRLAEGVLGLAHPRRRGGLREDRARLPQRDVGIGGGELQLRTDALQMAEIAVPISAHAVDRLHPGGLRRLADVDLDTTRGPVDEREIG